MTQYHITGMSCAACSARVEKAVSAVEGVESCSVSLLTNSMGVEGSASPEAVMQAVAGAGYGAALKSAEKTAGSSPADLPDDTETPRLLRRLKALGYDGWLTIEREISGPQQIADIKAAKVYLEEILNQMKEEDAGC